MCVFVVEHHFWYYFSQISPSVIALLKFLTTGSYNPPFTILTAFHDKYVLEINDRPGSEYMYVQTDHTHTLILPYILYKINPWLPMVNSLPKDKILHWSKLKAFADDKINVTKI